MSAPALAASSAPPSSTSLSERLLNVLVSPGDVFNEVIATPRDTTNWRAPTLIVCLAGIISLQIGHGEYTASTVRQLAEAGAASKTQVETLAAGWPLVSSLLSCLTVFAGTFWSAFVLWFMGRLFLRVRFSYLKTLEIVGLTGIILGLGTMITSLLIAASGNAAARPSLSLLAGNLDATHPFRQPLDIFNVFHLWTTTVLAIGLSKLSGASFKESAFWVFGYWLFARVALVVLG
jgi:hypothetical protein